MHYDKAYVIGFEGKKSERLIRFYESCKMAGVKTELFPAVNGRKIITEEWKVANYLSDDFDLRMPGSLGCLLSHVTLWEQISNDETVDIALICEDDALLDNDFLEKLKNIHWNNVPEDWDVIRLACHKVTGDSISEYLVKPYTKYIKGANAGTYCYLMKSKSAEKLKSVLIPYSNKQSMDVMLKKRSDQYHLYVLKESLAHEQRFRYSVRKDMNLSHKEGNWLKKLLVLISGKWFR
jgi:GR25 family glycosyltransferase involved in LPS biosynthesis